MSIEVKIPSVGESITSGLLSIWHKKDGETVAVGDLLFTLETDKVSSEVQANDPGTLKILVQEGEEVKIGQVVGSIDANVPSAAAATPTTAKSKTPEPSKSGGTTSVSSAGGKDGGPRAVAPVETPRKEPAKPATPHPKESAPSSGIPAKELQAPKPSSTSAASGERTTRKKMSPLRRKIAAQLVSAQQTAAILTTFNECDMSTVMSLRKQMQETFQKTHGVKLGFMSFFVKAVVNALKEIPSINSRIDGEEQVQNHYYDIGVAVGTEKGLMVPVLRDCDKMSLADIERALGDYAVKAREGKIGLEDLQGGVFTISNGGIYGSLMSTPILNPPQSGILGMHKIQERPIAIEGKVEIRPMMYLALSYDHRVVDGKEAVTFLIKVKEAIEQPVGLFLV